MNWLYALVLIFGLTGIGAFLEHLRIARSWSARDRFVRGLGQYELLNFMQQLNTELARRKSKEHFLLKSEEPPE